MAELAALEGLDRPFDWVPRLVTEDDRISWKAKGLFLYLNNRPPGWQINRTDLERRAIDGKAAVASAVKELERFGYLRIVRTRTPDGRVSGSVWSLRIPGKPASLPLQPGNQDQGNRDMGNRDVYQDQGKREDVEDQRSSRLPSVGNRVEGENPALQLISEDDVPPSPLRVADHLVKAWLSEMPVRPSDPDVRKMGAVAKRIAETRSVEQIAYALRGISEIFPHNREGWDLFDLEKKFSKAVQLGVAGGDLEGSRDKAKLLRAIRTRKEATT